MHRYNIDGTLREETKQERREREAKKGGRVFVPIKDQFERAKSDILGTHLTENDVDQDQIGLNKIPWSFKVDKILFGREGEATFRRYDPRYQDFKEFYLKYLGLVKQKQSIKDVGESQELEIARNALVLFYDFLQKKESNLKLKIEKDRASLPIKALESQIIDTIRQHQVVLIAADTGAGKSTQVPQYLLSAGFQQICCTQPRRIACYSLAKRVSYESLDQYGSEIAYQVRFEGTKTTSTKILFLTEGVLLRQYIQDPLLSMYNVIIVDEVHERHLNGDFLLAVLKRLISKRSDVRIVLMSATINAALFSEYFKAPIIEVPGRMYPVSIEYIPSERDDRNLVDEKLYNERMNAEIQMSVAVKSEKLKLGPYLKIIEQIDQMIPSSERGDLLVFLPGMNEMTLLAEQLQHYAEYTRKWIILMLHSTLSAAEQEKVFHLTPAGVRKCILSTNIAETSVTIDGIRFVIDSGKVKEMMYYSASKLSRLQEFWISQSSAKQRAGRAGRTGPGKCFRLYSKNEFDHLNSFPVSEILRTCLDPLVLQIKGYDLGDPREFDFIERPSTLAIEQSMHRLIELGALDEHQNITDLGSALSLLPVDVVLGKMLLLGSICDIIEPILVVAAALSISSPFVRIQDSESDVLSHRKLLFSDHGDPFTFLNIYSEWLRIKSEGQSSSKWCKRHGIEEQRLYELVKLKEQFASILKQFKGSDEDLEVDSKKRSFETEQEYWMDPEAKRKREQRFLLKRQKGMQATKQRRVLNMVEAENESTEPSIDELEFSLKHDAVELLGKSDMNSLSKRDIHLIKLVLCSGLYPNLAISDEANYARKLQEQAYHTISKKQVFSFILFY